MAICRPSGESSQWCQLHRVNLDPGELATPALNWVQGVKNQLVLLPFGQHTRVCWDTSTMNVIKALPAQYELGRSPRSRNPHQSHWPLPSGHSKVKHPGTVRT